MNRILAQHAAGDQVETPSECHRSAYRSPSYYVFMLTTDLCPFFWLNLVTPNHLHEMNRFQNEVIMKRNN
ncbi:MAG: hypothetical protein E6K65_17550 [Nitrospirae bacterium]|nr:MAG: hypothetical protein E6K65_17550 [Nitrospirota bacterium]